ncbi:MAG: tetratricopeptide repeat protein [Gammaproteobacteria bacterium]
MVHNTGAVLTLLACLACYGCQSISPTHEAEQGASVLALKNLVGEECQLQESGASENSDLAKRHFEVFCGRWENPSGRIFEVASNDGSLDSWMKGGWWNETVNRRLECGENKPGKVLDGVEALVTECKLRNGGWPYIVLIARVAGATYLADGIPAVLPVLEQGIGVVSGKLIPSMAGEGRAKSSAVAELEAKLRGRLYGAGDLGTYYRLMTAGQFYNSAKDFAAAANRYREALALHERILGIENSETLDPLMHLALELSNQGHFTEAQSLFNRAEVLAKQAQDPSDRARYLSYRALHAANQHQFTEALDYARQSTVLRRELASQTTGLATGSIGDTGQGVAVTGRADVSVLGNVKSPVAVDIVQSLHIEAAMLRRLGDLAQADAVLQEASATLQQADEAPPTWEPEILGLSAKIAKSRGANEEREQRLGSAATLWDEVAPGERPGAITYLNLGQAYRDRRRYGDAMVAFRRGIRLIKSRGGGLSFNQLLPFMMTAYELAQTQPSKRDALYREMFEAGQLVRGGQTAQDIARAAARLAASEGGTGDLVRELQENQEERYFLYRAYEAEVAQGQTKDNQERLEKLRERIAKVNEQIQEGGAQVQAAFPGYNQLMDASVEAKRVADLVGPAEALVQVLLGDPESFVFLVRQGSVSVRPLPISARDRKRCSAVARWFATTQ